MSIWNRDFLTTKSGLLCQHAARRKTRLVLRVEGIEPQSKAAMPLATKERLRGVWIDQVNSASRRPFRGKVALRLEIGTSNPRTPSHIQSIAKNLLDLLGRTLDGPPSDEAAIYRDDSQVEALSVSCRHGCIAPFIEVTAMPYGAYLDDMALAAHAEREGPEDDAWHERQRRSSEATAALRRTLRDREFEELCGQETYNAWVDMERDQAQEAFLLDSETSIERLAYLHGVGGLHWRSDRVPSPLTGDWQELFRSSPIRIDLGPLPHKPGTTMDFKTKIRQRVSEFLDRYGWVLSPLRVPVALEVFVKPPRDAPAHIVHDLDNVVRDYLVGPVQDALKPPSSYHFRYGKSGSSGSGESSPPPSVRTGLLRYEAWRLKRFEADIAEGFVCLNFVYEAHGYGDSLRRIDNAIERWKDAD